MLVLATPDTVAEGHLCSSRTCRRREHVPSVWPLQCPFRRFDQKCLCLHSFCSHTASSSQRISWPRAPHQPHLPHHLSWALTQATSLGHCGGVGEKWRDKVRAGRRRLHGHRNDYIEVLITTPVQQANLKPWSPMINPPEWCRHASLANTSAVSWQWHRVVEKQRGHSTGLLPHVPETPSIWTEGLSLEWVTVAVTNLFSERCSV